MMRYIQKAICGAKTFSDTPIYSQLQNIIFTTVEDQSNSIGSFRGYWRWLFLSGGVRCQIESEKFNLPAWDKDIKGFSCFVPGAFRAPTD